MDHIGQIDLTSYVNFAQIKKIAQANANSKNYIFDYHLFSPLVRANALGFILGMHGNHNEIRNFVKSCENSSIEETT